MADQQKIHPVDVEAPPAAASTPLVPRNMSPSDDKIDPPVRRTIPATYSPPPKKKKSGCSFCKCICWTILTSVLLVATVAATAGILYLVFNPKLPRYSVDRLRITDFTVDAALTARASFDLMITATNPNKRIGIYYENGSKLSVWYSDADLCGGSLPAFYQGHRNTTVLTATLSGQTQLGSGLIATLRRQQETGRVPLRFRGDVPVRVKLGGVKLWKVTSKVRCDLVVNSLNANNQISIRTSSCKFGLRL